MEEELSKNNTTKVEKAKRKYRPKSNKTNRVNKEGEKNNKITKKSKGKKQAEQFKFKKEKLKIEVTTENYKYLQLLDILNNRDNIKIETDSEREIIYSFINDNNLDVAKIFEYARKTNSKKAIERLYELG